MPLRRSLCTVLSLAALGMTSVVAQEKNPFAEWDRVQSRTPVKNRIPSLSAQPIADAKGMTCLLYTSNRLPLEETQIRIVVVIYFDRHFFKFLSEH